ncbi:hypothetical protein K466DRAFT_558917 [Polyporus arcularius HHB13444]|uniref:Uncharacterized protein n=1 Tax=Polyporus arcularius HHB13444 TaxID=1314778 RepID=A0A5C3P473_9APHY|nr:hypothetical protein K466DRAFT_558917 [Polyporus arcularius HHB13444]
MPIVSASVDTFVVLATAVLIPAILVLRRQPQSFTLQNGLYILTIFHTLLQLYTIIVRFPPNIFQTLKIPLTTPSETIRAVLLQRAGLPPDAPLPKPLETLLTRLSSFDTRTLYVRFGQSVIQDCEHCTTFDEYAIFAAPRIALGYVKEAAVVGFVTIRGSGHERWRTYAIGALVGAFILEGYKLGTTSVRIPRDGMGVFMWHDNLWLIRHLFFLTLPLLIHFLPRSAPPQSPIPLLAAAHAELRQTRDRLSTARFVHAATQRDPALRAASAEWWDRQRVEGEWARTDEHVRHAAEKLGKGIAEDADGAAGRLRQKVRAILRQMLESVALAPGPAAVVAGR